MLADRSGAFYVHFILVMSMYLFLQVLILSVENTSSYWVRILEHKALDSQQAGTHTHTADSTDFLELTMSINGWFADPSHIVKQEQVSVGDLCALMTNGKPFQRYS